MATYAGDANYGMADPSQPLVQKVNQVKPVFSPLISSENPSTFGDPVTFTATLTGVSGDPQPSGNVVFTDTYNGVPKVLCTSPLTQNGTNNSTATCSTPPPILLGGTHSIVATYAGDANYGPADPSAPFGQPVNKAKPVFSPLISSKNPSTYGDPVTFTATLTGVSGYPQPSGNVVFTDTYNGVPTVLCTSPLSAGANNSKATCSTPPPILLGGSHNIVATYGDDSNYGPANPSPTLVQTVNKAKPVFSPLQSSKDPSTFGDPVTFTATLTGIVGDPQPTGNVVFTDTYNNVPTVLCTSPLTQNGTNNSTATCSTPPPVLMAGMHSIVATYTDDTNYTSADPSFPPLMQTVKKAKPVFSPLVSDNPNAIYGQPITFTATLTGASGDPQPTGKVVFTDTYNGVPTAICTSPLSPGASNSTATCTPSPTLLAGSHSIVASYADNTDYGTADPSAALVQTVQKAKPTASIASSLNPSVSTQPTTFAVLVTGVSGGLKPTGTVTFTSNAASIPDCSPTPNPVPLASGQATCTTTTLASGIDTIAAVYSGDNNYTDSEPSLSQTVQDFSPGVTFTPGVTPGVVSIPQSTTNTSQPFNQQTITFSAMSSSGFANSLTLTCQVTQINGQEPGCDPVLSPVPFVNGTATTTFTITTLTSTPIGNYTATVTATDPASGLLHSANFAVLVTNTIASIGVTPGQPGTANSVSFVGSTSATVTFSCPTVVGPGLPASGESPGVIGIACQFSPASTTVNPNSPTPVQITVTAATKSARLTPPARILATLWLGMPAIVLIGSLRFGKLSRRKVLQLLGILVVVVAVLQGIGCGGGINNRPSAPITPGGSYDPIGGRYGYNDWCGANFGDRSDQCDSMSDV